MARSFVAASVQYINFPNIASILGTGAGAIYSGAIRYRVASHSAARLMIGLGRNTAGSALMIELDLLATGESRIAFPF